MKLSLLLTLLLSVNIANAKKLKLGVYPINVIHGSPGLQSFDDSFKASEDAFMQEYAG